MARVSRPRLLVHVIPDTANAGAENQARYLIEELSRGGEWEIEIVYFRTGVAHEQFVQLGLPMHHLVARGPEPLALLSRAYELWRLYRRRVPAILHTWLFEANFVGALAARGWPQTGLIVSQRSGNLERETPRVLRASQVIRARADHVISNSADGFALLAGLGFDPNRMSIIGNGFPPSNGRLGGDVQTRTRCRERLGVEPRSPLVGYVGRIDPAKDLDTLFEAMAVVWQAIPAATLVMVGPQQHELSGFEIARPEAVQATGWVPDAAQLMPAFDVMVSSSWTEGHSNAVCEALLAGVPVACTATGDHAEIVAAAEGKVVPIRRPEVLGSAIIELLRARPKAELIAGTAATHLSLDRMVGATDEVYRLVRANRADRTKG